MKLDLNSQTLNVSFACRIEDAWVPVPETACTQSGFDWTLNGAHYSAQFTPAGDTLCYTLQMDAPNPTQLRMWLAVPGQSDYFHVIPCNIYGDNHAAEAKPGEFPLLTKDHHEVAFCAPLWEFRADRAAMPLAAVPGTVFSVWHNISGAVYANILARTAEKKEVAPAAANSKVVANA